MNYLTCLLLPFFWFGGESIDHEVLSSVVEGVVIEMNRCLPDDCKVNVSDYTKLLTETAIYESSNGMFTKQINGRALGIFQIEVSSHNDVFNHYLRRNTTSVYRRLMINNIDSYLLPLHSIEYQLQYNISYQSAIAFMVYYRRLGNDSLLTTKLERAIVYKKFYNTSSGKATISRFLEINRKFSVDR